ncbi:MAG: hypothetical protein HFJ10_13560 [Lachnospiraceae bacterium]|jgi:hypothetical protein|nr:hypothetical protein [Lachnospiraceae bacterium]
MAEQELWTEILMQAQTRYRVLDEVLRVTKEIADALSRDDRVSVQMLLGMRQDEIQSLYENEQRIYRLLECASKSEKEEMLELLQGDGENLEEDSFEKKKVGEIGRNIKRNREKIIDLDRAISTKLAGKDSFYETK